jgi:MFS transporter
MGQTPSGVSPSSLPRPSEIHAYAGRVLQMVEPPAPLPFARAAPFCGPCSLGMMFAGAQMTVQGSIPAVAEESQGDQRLAILLAMAMFVLVVDTSLMNVSISAVVHDLDTTASGVQSAIALEALVSAAFILIGSKIGDMIGRKRAYVLGLLGYAAGALSMTSNSAGGSLGLAFGLAFAGAIMLASLSLVFSHMAQSSTQLQKNAEVPTNTHVDKLLVGQPEDVRKEIIHINTKSRPIALQIALAIPLLAALLGLLNGFRMTQLPDPQPSAAAEGMVMG